jgi:hypothetical protein
MKPIIQESIEWASFLAASRKSSAQEKDSKNQHKSNIQH